MVRISISSNSTARPHQPVASPECVRALRCDLAGIVRSCHDLSEGGLAVAAAEMAFAGHVGADLTDAGKIDAESDIVRLFSESPTRFLVEVTAANAPAFQRAFDGLPIWKLGTTVKEPRLRIAGANGEWLVWANLDELKEAWQKPLRW